MQTLSLAHFQSIEYVIKGGDYNYISAHLAVDIPQDASLFAKIQINGNSALWYMDDNATYTPITEASPEDRLAALQDLKFRKERVLSQLSGKVKYAEQLFIVPDEEQIFFTRRNGRVEAVLSQWGFRHRNDVTDEDVLSVLINGLPEPPEQMDVRVKATYSDGLPAANLPMLLEWVGSQQFVTDANGYGAIGPMMDGVKFTIVDKDGNRFPFSVEKGKETYEILLPLYVSYEIQVVNQEGTPKPGYVLNVDRVPVSSDEEGMVRAENVLLQPDKRVEVHDETGHAEQYALQRDGNSFRFEVTDRFTSELQILCRWEDGVPLEDCPVLVDGATYRTDAAGIVCLRDLEPGKSLTVGLADNLVTSRVVTLERGRNEVILEKERERPRMVCIRVRDYDGSPLVNVHLRMRLAKGSCEVDTDNEGCVYLPETMFSDKEKVKFSFDYERSDKKKDKKKKKGEKA